LERAEQEGIAALALFAPQQFNVEIGIALRDGDPTVIERKLVDGSLKQVASSCPRGAPATRG
jgi:hypothetical protein